LAEAKGANLIAMPVAGRDGLLDALRGSTSERVVSKANCPVLALPVAA
jgi:nucleotide-binding universal stress UspA family protein